MTLEQFNHLRTPTAFAVMAVLLLWEGAAPFFLQFRSKGGRLSHGTKNVFLGIMNAVVTALVFTGLWLTVADWAAAHHFGLLRLTELPPWLHATGAVLLLDLWTYWWHRVCHRVPMLWNFHRVHHSDASMDVTTANRFHLGEMLASSVLRLAVIPLAGMEFWHLALYELLMFSVVQFQHANISVGPAFDRALRLVIVTPFMHKVHHSDRQPETDSNYASLFSIWDRIFGSFRLREDPSAIRLGLREFDAVEHQTVAGLLRTPFAKVPPEKHDGSRRS